MIVVAVKTGNFVRAEPRSIYNVFCLYLVSAFGSERIKFAVIGYRRNPEIADKVGTVIHSVANCGNRQVIRADNAGRFAKQSADNIF